MVSVTVPSPLSRCRTLTEEQAKDAAERFKAELLKGQAEAASNPGTASIEIENARRRHMLGARMLVRLALRATPMADRIRCGDTVRHEPSGESWLVAYADYDTGEMSWCGFPEGTARIEVSIWLDPPDPVPGRIANTIRRLYRPLPPEWDPIALGC